VSIANDDRILKATDRLIGFFEEKMVVVDLPLEFESLSQCELAIQDIQENSSHGNSLGNLRDRTIERGV
jgi:hypothetical protein